MLPPGGWDVPTFLDAIPLFLGQDIVITTGVVVLGSALALVVVRLFRWLGGAMR